MATANRDLIEVMLELETASGPIRGSVRSENGERSFSGWIELTAALENVRSATAAQAGADPQRPNEEE